MGRIRAYAPRKTRIIRLEDAAKARIAAGDPRFWVSLGTVSSMALRLIELILDTVSSCRRIITFESQLINIRVDENIENLKTQSSPPAWYGINGLISASRILFKFSNQSTIDMPEKKTISQRQWPHLVMAGLLLGMAYIDLNVDPNWPLSDLV